MKLKFYFLTVLICYFSSQIFSQDNNISFHEIYKREIPEWFNQDKFGIFVVWGLYSVPSYKEKGYAEWYWEHSKNNPDSKKFHERVYGKDFMYEQFADQFKAELWDPDFWCDIFKKAGAKYVVTTASYHDGFAMYPSKYSKTENTDNWNSVVAGPKRDIIGELKEAGEKKGLKMGIYYSVYEWYHPLWLSDQERYVDEHLHPKFKEVVSSYSPWFIFLDGEWAKDYKFWKSEELAHWLYSESSCKDYVVVNDRWGNCRGIFGDVFESEYGEGKYASPKHPWQEDRGIGSSYGYNRTENIFDYDTEEELIKTFSNVVGGGGNFLLCVGPTADGRIPVIMQERLLQIGKWLETNGDAIYGSQANPFWPHRFNWGTATQKPGKLFLHVHDRNLNTLTISGIDGEISNAVVLTSNGKVPVTFFHRDSLLQLDWDIQLNSNSVTLLEIDIQEPHYFAVPRTRKDNTIEFNVQSMKIHGEKAYVNYDGYRDRLRVLDWTDPKEYISSEFYIDEPGTYKVELIYAGNKPEPSHNFRPHGMKGTGDSKFVVEIGDNKLQGSVMDTGGAARFKKFETGTVVLAKPGIFEIDIKPIDNGSWKGFLLQGVVITKLEQ